VAVPAALKTSARRRRGVMPLLGENGQHDADQQGAAKVVNNSERWPSSCARMLGFQQTHARGLAIIDFGKNLQASSERPIFISHGAFDCRNIMIAKRCGTIPRKTSTPSRDVFQASSPRR